MTRCASRSSIFTSFCRSPSSIRETGMCVHDATTLAMSSSVTSCRSKSVRPATCRRDACATFQLRQLLFQIRNLAVLNFRRLGQIAAALRLLQFNLRLLQLRLHHADGVDGGFFILPLRGERLGFFLQVGDFLVNQLEPLLARGVFFLRQRRALDFQLQNLAVQLVQFRRLGIQFHLDARRRLVHEVNRLVRQKPVGDVAMRQRRRRDERGILDAHAVMHFVALLQSAQNRDGRLDRRLVHLAPAGSGVPAPGLSRCACGIRRASSRRRSAIRRARAAAS